MGRLPEVQRLQRRVIWARARPAGDPPKDLMRPELWRIYCLLAGDLQDATSSATNWRIAFAAFMWYRCSVEPQDLEGAVRGFVASIGQEGGSLSARPTPPYYVGKTSSTQPQDACPPKKGVASPALERGRGGVEEE